MAFKKLSKVLCAGLIGGSLLTGSTADAAIATNLVPLYTYAEHKVPTYDKPGGAEKGFITANVALVYIKEIRSDGWAFGSYTIAGGQRISRWFQMQSLQGYTDYQNYTTSFGYNQDVYRNTTSNAIAGTLFGNQEVTVVGETADLLKIIYKSSNGKGYRMGWVYKPAPPSEGSDDGGGGENNPFGSGTIIIQGDVHLNNSFNKDSQIDNSINDSSTTNIDNSYNDNSTTTNVTNIDKSTHTSNTTVDARDFSKTTNVRAGGSMLGDVNGNSKVNMLDAVDLIRYLSGATDGLTNKDNADLNKDGKITDDDLILLIKKIKSNGTAVGDLNNDNKLDDEDVKLLKTKIGGRAIIQINEKEADVNGDTRINSQDVSTLETVLKYLNSKNLKITF